MQPLLIEATDDSPNVVLDDQNQVFLFEGECRPQHAFKFFQPIIQWLEEYGKILYWQKGHFGKSRKLSMQFKLNYFNSTSAKFIGDILSILERFNKEGYEAQVLWYYHKEDLDMMESAEEYMKMMQSLPFSLLLIEE